MFQALNLFSNEENICKAHLIFTDVKWRKSNFLLHFPADASCSISARACHCELHHRELQRGAIGCEAAGSPPGQLFPPHQSELVEQQQISLLMDRFQVYFKWATALRSFSFQIIYYNLFFTKKYKINF